MELAVGKWQQDSGAGQAMEASRYKKHGNSFTYEVVVIEGMNEWISLVAFIDLEPQRDTCGVDTRAGPVE